MLSRISNFIPQFILTYLYHIEYNSHTYIVMNDGTAELIMTDRPMTVNDFNVMKQQYEHNYNAFNNLDRIAKNQENYKNYGLHNISA